MAASEFSPKSVGVVIACGIGAILSGASIMANSASVFILPITAELHWRRTELSGLMLVALLAAGIVTPFIGKLVDRFGARPVVLWGVVAFSLSTMAVSMVGHSILKTCLVFGLFGVTAPAVGAVGFNKALSAWFRARRGIVLALVGMGGALGAVAVPQITRLLIDHFGWRAAYVGLGAIVLVVGFPVLALLFREPPRVRRQDLGVPTLFGPANVAGATLREILRSTAFWLIVGAIGTNIFVGVGLQFHVVPLLADRGLSFDRAVNLSSYFGLGQVGGQLLAGYLLDRYDTPRVVMPFFICSLIGLLLLDYGHGAAMVIVAGLMLRVGVGAELSIAPYLLARYFGLKAFGQAYGTLYFLSSLAAGVGVQAMSFCFDQTHSYRLALIVSEILLALGVLCVARLGPYVYAAGHSDIEEAHVSRAPLRRVAGGE